MEIIVGNMAGFCGGVSNAVEKAKQEIENMPNNIEIHCLGELVHNQEVMKKLFDKGMKLIEDIEHGSDKVIIRAHGVTKDVYEKAKNRGITLVDLTCKKVLKIHEMAETYAKKECYIFLIGDKKHPEVIGTFSFCGKYVTKIADEEDIEEGLYALKKSNIQQLVILSQTTYSVEKFDKIIRKIKEKLPKNVECVIHKTICDATRLRQEETQKIAKQVDGMIIIGGENSSNTQKLYEIAKKNCKHAVLVQNREKLKLEEWGKHEKIGIMAGASTPKESIDEIVTALKECIIYA